MLALVLCSGRAGYWMDSFLSSWNKTTSRVEVKCQWIIGKKLPPLPSSVLGRLICFLGDTSLSAVCGHCYYGPGEMEGIMTENSGWLGHLFVMRLRCWRDTVNCDGAYISTGYNGSSSTVIPGQHCSSRIKELSVASRCTYCWSTGSQRWSRSCTSGCLILMNSLVATEEDRSSITCPWYEIRELAR
jgi:hypothetical protein